MSMKIMLRQPVRGFTLLELLIVVGIIAILSTAVVLVINPLELLRQARDTNRLNDLVGKRISQQRLLW